MPNDSPQTPPSAPPVRVIEEKYMSAEEAKQQPPQPPEEPRPSRLRKWGVYLGVFVVCLIAVHFLATRFFPSNNQSVRPKSEIAVETGNSQLAASSTVRTDSIRSQEPRPMQPAQVLPQSKGIQLVDSQGHIRPEHVRVAVATASGEIEYVSPDDPRALTTPVPGKGSESAQAQSVPIRPATDNTGDRVLTIPTHLQR